MTRRSFPCRRCGGRGPCGGRARRPRRRARCPRLMNIPLRGPDSHLEEGLPSTCGSSRPALRLRLARGFLGLREEAASLAANAVPGPRGRPAPGRPGAPRPEVARSVWTRIGGRRGRTSGPSTRARGPRRGHRRRRPGRGCTSGRRRAPRRRSAPGPTPGGRTCRRGPRRRRRRPCGPRPRGRRAPCGRACGAARRRGRRASRRGAGARARPARRLDWGEEQLRRHVPGYEPLAFAPPYGAYGQLATNDPAIP